MIDIIKIINSFSLLCGRYIDEDIDILKKYAEDFSNLSDDELRQKCQNRDFSFNDETPSVWNIIFNKIPFIAKRTDDATLRKLALGVAAFKKVPADLNEGAELFPCQIKAALALTQSCVLQMDTGEGKTYALLPTAFALACKHGKVYILCANDYLAYRDAMRTKNYWDFIGLDVQYLSQNEPYSEKWQGDVIYTTLTALMFKGMNDEIHNVAHEIRLSFSAIIIDEVDAVLFESSPYYSQVIEVQSKAYDWQNAIGYAQNLGDEDVTFDKSYLTASLTVTGDEKTKKYLREQNVSIFQYGQFRKAVESAYIALNVDEDREYVVINETVYANNIVTGEIEYNRVYDWLIPLGIMLGKKPRPHSVTLHKAPTTAFLSQFAHLSGMSGTVKDDAAEYLYSYLLPTIIIEPRKKRQAEGIKNDEIYLTRNTGIVGLCYKIKSALDESRPVLVGTQNIKDATEIYNIMKKILGERDDVTVNIITGKDDKNVAKIYNSGGEVGSVIIATQLAGRGVDIRLSEKAKTNGGLALLCFERALEMRHDKQFLGRAGRQGDPFTSQFVVTLESELIKNFNGENIANMMKKLGTSEGEALEHKWLNKSIVLAQNRIRNREFMKRRNMDLRNATDATIYGNIKNWFENLNTKDDEEGKFLPKSFIQFTVNHFIKYALGRLIRRDLNCEEAEQLATTINTSVGLANIIRPIDMEGKKEEYMREKIRNELYNNLSKIWDRNKTTYTKKSQFLAYIDSMYKYESVQYRVDGILKIVNHPEDVVNCGEFKKLVATVSHNGLLRINNAGEWKQFYLLLFFLEKNISFMPKTQYEEAVRLLEQFNLEWYGKLIYSITDELRKLFDRSPRSVVRWTIHKCEIDFAEYEAQTEHNLRMQDINTLQFYRILSDKLTSEWDKLENSLSSMILTNLSANPLDINDLFFYTDNQAESSQQKNRSEELAKEWDILTKGVGVKTATAAQDDQNRKLISEFVALSSSEFGIGFGVKNLEHLLGCFLNASPVNTLQTPEKILGALEKWKENETLDSGKTLEGTLRKYDLLKKFLMFLSYKRSIAVMPSFKHKINSVFNKLMLNIRDFKIAVPIIQMALFGLFFTLLGIFGARIEYKNPLPFGIIVMDDILCAGLLSGGFLIAPVFLLYFLSNHPNKKNIGANFLLGVTGAFLFAFALADSFGFIGLVKFIFTGLLLSLFYIKSVGMINYIDDTLNLSLFSAWLVFSISYALVFGLFAASGALTVIVFLGIILYYCLVHRRMNRMEITLISTRITGSYMNLESEACEMVKETDGNVMSLPHIYAFTFSLVVCYGVGLLPVLYGEYSGFIAVFTYLTIILLMTKEIMKTRFDANSWKQKLCSRGQILVDRDSDDVEEGNTEIIIGKIKRRLFGKEIGLHFSIVILCVLLLWKHTLYDTQYPLGLLVVFSAFLMGEHSVKFIKQLTQLFIFRGRIVNKTLDFNEISEQEEKKTIVQKIRDFFNPFNKTKKVLNNFLKILAVFYVLEKIFNFVN